MNCEIIRDLLPLYTDGVCSDAAKEEVEKHLAECADCRTVYEDMKRDLNTARTQNTLTDEKAIYLRTRQHIGNFLIGCLLLVIFVAAAFGAFNEVGEHGWQQGIFALTIIIPATAYLLSLINCFFFRIYPSRKIFCAVSTVAAFLLNLAGDAFAVFYYQHPEGWTGLIPYALGISVVLAGAQLITTRLYCTFFDR